MVAQRGGPAARGRLQVAPAKQGRRGGARHASLVAAAAHLGDLLPQAAVALVLLPRVARVRVLAARVRVLALLMRRQGCLLWGAAAGVAAAAARALKAGPGGTVAVGAALVAALLLLLLPEALRRRLGLLLLLLQRGPAPAHAHGGHGARARSDRLREAQGGGLRRGFGGEGWEAGQDPALAVPRGSVGPLARSPISAQSSHLQRGLHGQPERLPPFLADLGHRG